MYTEPSVLPQSGGKYQLTVKECPQLCGHNDFEVRERTSPGYFIIAMCSELSAGLLCPGSQTFVFYSKKTRMDSACFLYLQGIRIPSNYVFVGHGYLQHARPGWKEHHALQYHKYIKPVEHSLNDA